MAFRNLRDLEKHIQQQREKELERIIYTEAKKLRHLIKREILNYYRSYTPVVYERTYRFANSIRVEQVKRAGDELYVRIYFDQGLANHQSLFGGEQGFVPNLINYGWQWNSGQTDPYRFARYSGYNFIEKAVEQYMKDNPHGFNIQVEGVYDGQTYQSKWY